MDVSFLFATDLHGDIRRMDALIEKANDLGYPTIILGGDLFRAGRGSDIETQSGFLVSEVDRRFEAYRGEVLTIFGNNDWKVVADNFGELCPSIESIEGKRRELDDGSVLIGLSYVPPTPFLIKDWERPERFGPNDSRGRIDGLCSTEAGLVDCSIIARETIWEKIMALGDLRNTIIVSHGPPYGTCADVSAWGEHLGSRDLSRAIKIHCPEAVLCGHVHESPDRSGKAVCQYERTIIANPGSRRGDLTCIIGRRDRILGLEYYDDKR
jgi:Icc-related predicted phosphoesterase